MRKVFWCCLAAGATVCCAFWAAAYLTQNPDSSLRHVALVASSATGEPLPQAAHSGGGAVETDELIPADPVPVDAAPTIPEPGFHLPREIAGLLTPPPIVIHDEEAINVPSSPSTKTESKLASTSVDVAGAQTHTADISESLKPRSPLMMPYCKENAAPAPNMPYCAEDDSVPTMPPAPVEDMEKVSGAARPQFNALAFWMGFFSGPGQMTCDSTYTVEKAPLPGAEETSEPAAHKGDNRVDPLDLFSHSRHLQMPRPAEVESDTMEMRPSDWKPYSLDPGPF